MVQSYLKQPNNSEKKLQAWDWILIIGITLSPMNRLRTWKVGPGELLCILWSLKYIWQLLTVTINNCLLRFWLVFLPVIVVGTAYGQLFFPKETEPGALLTWVYFFFISVSIYTGMSTKSPEQIKKFLVILSTVVTLWYMFLYIYSKNVSRIFLGVNLWYWQVRYSGGGNNPHLLASLIAGVMFFNVYLLFDKGSVLKKILPLICTVFNLIIALATKSSTLYISLVVTMVSFAVYRILTVIPGKRGKWVALSVMVIITSLFLGLTWTQLYEMIYAAISGDANGMGRLEIFKSIVVTLKKNWVFGLGPGTHGMDGTIEYHNTYLEILAMGGVIGLGLFTAFSWRLYKLIRPYRWMLFGVLPLYLYGMGGFTMRRLSSWAILAILIACADRSNEAAKRASEPGAAQARSSPAALEQRSFLKRF